MRVRWSLCDQKKALKSCPKSNKSPNLVTQARLPGFPGCEVTLGRQGDEDDAEISRLASRNDPDWIELRVEDEPNSLTDPSSAYSW